MRLTLTEEETLRVCLILKKSEYAEDVKLAEKIEKQWSKPIKSSKRNATKKATETKQEVVKSKIRNAINLMRLEGEKMTAYSVSKKAEVSYNSARKYENFFK